MKKLSSTKVQGFWFFAIVSTVLVATGKLSGENYIVLVPFLFGIFSAANVAQKKVLDE